MTRLLLLRHGHIEDRGLMEGHSPTPLSRRGRAEALLAGRALCAVRDDLRVIYSSPLLRARQTAETVAGWTGIPLSTRRCAFLAEIDCGELNGVSMQDVRERHPDLWTANQCHDDDGFRWPGGESYRELRARALRGLHALACAHRGERIVLVTHTGVISQVLGWMHGLSAARWDNYRPRSASFTELLIERGRWRSLGFDDARHLAPLSDR